MDRGTWILIARVCLSAVYIYSGVDKIVNWPKSIAWCNNLNIPRPEWVLAGTIAVQLIAGPMLLVGFHAREGAVALLLFTFVATLVAHNPLRHQGDARRREIMLSLEHLAIIGGLLLIAIDGPGPISFDALAVR